MYLCICLYKIIIPKIIACINQKKDNAWMYHIVRYTLIKNNDNSLLILKNDDKNCIIYVGSNNSSYVLLLKCQKGDIHRLWQVLMQIYIRQRMPKILSLSL